MQTIGATAARVGPVCTSAALSTGTLFVFAWLASGFWLVLQGTTGLHLGHLYASIHVLATVPACLPALWLIAQPGTPHLRVATAYCLSNWFWSLTHAMGTLPFSVQAHFWSQEQVDASHADKDFALTNLSFIASGAATIMVLVTTAYLVLSRFLCLESHAMRRMGFRPFHGIFWITIGVGTVVIYLPGSLSYAWPAGAVRDALNTTANALLYGCLAPFALCAIAVFTWRAWRAVVLMEAAAASAPPRAAPLAKKARVALRAELWGILVVVLTTGFHCLVNNVPFEAVIVVTGGHLSLVGWFVLQRLAALVDFVCNSYYALSMTGALSLKGSRQRQRLAQLRRQRWQAAKKAWSRREAGEGILEWDEKVRELAGRGISLSALLCFYKELPGWMPHWDSDVHTTADVVRQAIIPLSEPHKCAGAQVLMEGKPSVPKKMVTHAWSNLFRDLLAAIVADALGEGEFESFAKLMDHDMQCLEDWVRQAGVGGRTYWICAFSVNQHVGICGGNHRMKDSKTGEYCKRCHCGLTKCWNDTEPLLPDGRSVPCEMNKFDDMMRLLSMEDKSFAQVVPIDAKFETFGRAWCVAELATANEVGMVQDIKIRSAGDLAAHEKELHGLRIQDMKASRPEDKEAILANIPDHDRFNAFVQRMIFEDLLPSWNHLDALERMAVAGCIVRWQPTIAWAPDDVPIVDVPCKERAVKPTQEDGASIVDV